MRTSAWSLVLLLLLPGLAGAGSFIPLGNLPGGSINSSASGISADGSVVVGVSGSDSGYQAFRWTSDGGMVGLGYPAGGSASSASAISADGNVVVGTGSDNSRNYAFRWTSSDGMITLPDQLSSNSGSGARGISANGNIIVGFTGSEAAAWYDGLEVDGLGHLPGGLPRGSGANAVSADGSTVVGKSTSFASPEDWKGEAFVWNESTGMIGLGFLPEDNVSVSYGVSADGSTVVGMSLNSHKLDGEAFRWTSATGILGLGFLPGSSEYVGRHSAALAISADGSLVVGVGRSPDQGQNRAIIWTETDGMQDLLDLLVSIGTTGTSGWTLVQANAVSDDGQWVAGSGINPDGYNEAFLANISAVPIPPAVWLFGSALGLMGVMRRPTLVNGRV